MVRWKVMVGLAAFVCAAGVQAGALAPLGSMEGVGDYKFGQSREDFSDLLAWGQEQQRDQQLEIFVADFEPELGGIRFEARQLAFFEGKLARVSLLTTDLEASRAFLKLMLAAYGKPTSKPASGCSEWRAAGMTARYEESDKVVRVTYSSLEPEPPPIKASAAKKKPVASKAGQKKKTTNKKPKRKN